MLNELWEESNMYHNWTKGPTQEEPLLRFKGIDIIVRGEVHAISGQTACCKSLLAMDLMSAGINVNHHSSLSVTATGYLKVLLIDTEQSTGTINHRLNQILSRAMEERGIETVCERLFVMKSDTLSPKDIIEQMTIALTEVKPDLVIIDGLVDMTENFNDPYESRRLVQLLRNIAVQYNLAVVALIHENPHTDKARGHLGTFLIQKSWRAWSLERMGGVIKVNCVKARGEGHQPFAFSLKTNLELLEVPVPESVRDKITCQDLILLLLQRGHIKRCDLYKLLTPYRAPRTIDNEVSKLVATNRIFENKDTLALA